MTDWTTRSNNYKNLNWAMNKKFEDFFIQSVVENLPLKKLKFLDIGCGTGKHLKKIIKITDNQHEYCGIDNCEEMIQKCSDISYSENIKLHKIDCSGKGLSYFNSKKFDIIYSRMCFHHLDDLKNVFKQCYKLLNKSGKMIICEGIPFSHTILNEYKKIFKIKEPVRNIMSVEKLSNYYIDTGFNNIWVKYYIMENVSLKNWLHNADLSNERIEKIIKLHTTEASDEFKKIYKIYEKNEDVFMRWKFVVIGGQKL